MWQLHIDYPATNSHVMLLLYCDHIYHLFSYHYNNRFMLSVISIAFMLQLGYICSYVCVVALSICLILKCSIGYQHR